MVPLIQWTRRYGRFKQPIAFTGLYIFFSCLWIFVTDKLLGHFSPSLEVSGVWSTTKGLAYVVITGALIYLLLRRLWQIQAELEDIVASRTTALAASYEESRTREEWLRRLLASLPDVAWTSAEDGHTIFISPNVEGIFGFTPEEIYENGEEVWLGRIHPRDRERVIRGFQTLFSEGRPFDEEYEIQCKNGRWIWVHDRAVRTHNEDGTMFADGIFSDITERKEAQKARDVSDKRYRQLFERNLAGVFRAEAGGKMLDCNPALVQMLGYDSVNEILERRASEILYDPQEQHILLERLAKNGSINNVEIRLRRKNGSVLWGLNNVCFLESGNGNKPSIEGTVVDITEHRLTAEALGQQLSLMQAIASAAPDALFVTDAQGRITYMNPAAEGMFGYTAGEVLGKVTHDVFHYQRPDGTPLPISECVVAQAWKSGKTFLAREDVNFRKGGAAIDVSCSRAPLFEDGRITGSVLIVRDISQQKLAEKQYQSLQEQFLHAQKMEAVARLAFGIAHDFNNLLQVINGYSGLIADDSGEDAQLAKRARAIKQAGSRAARLTRQLMDFSRRKADDPQITSLDLAVKELLKMARSLVGEDIELVMGLNAPGSCVKISAGQLEQLIMNLVVNARDAMPKGGKLSIKTRCIEIDKAAARSFGNVPRGTYVQLSVSDSGCGMDAGTASRAFEPFFTTKERTKGTGLGLSTVYGIVTQNGGGIQVHSALGAGTTFDMCFPLAEPKVSLEEIKERLVPQAGVENILLAEDEDEVRQLISSHLSNLGYKVLEAGNGVEALQVATDAPQPLHLLISDMIMPKMGGQELTNKIREVWPAIKVVQMSGYTKAPPPTGEMAGAVRLQKPFTLEALAATVRHALDH